MSPSQFPGIVLCKYQSYFVVEGAEFTTDQFFNESYEQVQEHNL